jgi:hypothetical protein
MQIVDANGRLQRPPDSRGLLGHAQAMEAEGGADG